MPSMHVHVYLQWNKFLIIPANRVHTHAPAAGNDRRTARQSGRSRHLSRYRMPSRMVRTPRESEMTPVRHDSRIS